MILNFDSTASLTTQNVGVATSVAGHAIIAEKLCIIVKKSSSTVLDEEAEEMVSEGGRARLGLGRIFQRFKVCCCFVFF